MEKNKNFNHTDLTFFTNEKGSTLLDRFKKTLRDTQYFDVLVGYFRASGFYLLHESLESVEKIRILVGLSIDTESYDILKYYQQSASLDFESYQRTKSIFKKNLQTEIESSDEDDKLLEVGVRKFIEYLQTEIKNLEVDTNNGGNGKKLEIRAYPSKNIHAKVYIGKYHPKDRDYGFVITGSSNFSESGLVANREFNVELKQRADVEFAENQFDELWNESVDISEEFVDTITHKTWLNDQITPYELYLKLIYEYLEEDINLENQFDPFLPEGFMNLKYQSQAVIQAKKILDTYNGVFIADVVGLGKTFITALLLQQLQGRTLVVCPPVIQEYWKDSLFDFGIRSHSVQSLGKLEQILRKGADRYDYVVVDEAHRFRNDTTQSYAHLLDICRDKKVILVTATPLNNTVDDIYAQLKLFQSPFKSTIPGIPNLDKYFSTFRTKLSKLDKKDPSYKQLISDISEKIRNNILRYVMVRRTRKDVITYYSHDMKLQGLVFPKVKEPNKIVYKYEGKLEEIFNTTITRLQQFNYSRYTPLLYYIGNKSLTDFDKQQQKNIGRFMKGILVKRLESSFFAFKKSIDRFIISYQKFIKMFHTGTVYISKIADVYELIENDDIDTLESLAEVEKAHKYDSKDFKKEFVKMLENDLQLLKEIKELWLKVNSDPKLEKFITEIKHIETLKKNKLVIFTESKETGNYIYEAIHDAFPGKAMFYSSKGGRHTDKKLTSNHKVAKDIIETNFDPNRKKKDQQNQIRILIATDVLAEGINLHRSNVLINYDLPWNPTRVLQRAGRVNRLGSNYDFVHIYNFFPTSQADTHIGLERNITNKIQMFHDILGEDAKYLTDGEEFGSKQIFDILNNKNAYDGEDQQGDSELKYLDLIRNIRDKDPELFHKIKLLPKKARSGLKNKKISENQLITFFRMGKLKKFYLNKAGISTEITFFDAVKALDCEPSTRRENTPDDYFHLLETNKARFRLDNAPQQDTPKHTGGKSNAKYIATRLKDSSFKNYKGFTDSDDEFIKNVKSMLEQGTIAKKIAQNIKKELQNTIIPLEIIKILRKYIKIVTSDTTSTIKSFQSQEVILSGYIIK